MTARLRPLTSMASLAARAATAVLVRLTPKADLAVLAMEPAFDDTVRALLPRLAASRLRVVILVGAVPTRVPAWLMDDVVQVVPRRSLRGYSSYLRARLVCFSHGLYLSPKPPKGQLVVNCWHGMPIKRIRKLASIDAPLGFSALLSSSPDFSDVLAASFGVDDRSVWMTGLPRTDILVDKPSDPGLEQLRRPYVAWLPTHRRDSPLGRADDVGVSPDSRAIAADDVHRVASLLDRFGFSLVVKTHPLASDEEAAIYRHALTTVVTDEFFVDNSTTLYSVLAHAQLLITDYSSVAIDFLVTGNPIVFFVPDLNSYEQARGLNFSLDELRSIGCTTRTISELEGALDGLLSTRPCEGPVLPNKFYSAPAGGATDRLWDEISKRLKGTGPL